MKNLTYFLGAGASYQACPILKEMGERMVALSALYLTKGEGRLRDAPFSRELLEDIGRFGLLALNYGTIDTYARKLFINGNDVDLGRLKRAVSVFFTLWHFLHDNEVKKADRFLNIDQRYISLLAALLDKKNNNPVLRPNVKFVTWNYDLQIESAFKEFCQEQISWEDIHDLLKFRVKLGLPEPLQVCHLNGYHGFYQQPTDEMCLLDLPTSKNPMDILQQVDFIAHPSNKHKLNITNHINYAWEDSHIATQTRKIAQEIFSTTDILVIVGYSFPNFNKEIDKLLFEALKGRKVTIYCQDPNASEVFIKKLLGESNDVELLCETKKLDHFIFPYDF